MTTTDQQAAVDAFNAAHPVGTTVNYWRGVREGKPSGTGPTRSDAQLLSGHTAVVWIEGTSGCIALTHVEPVDPAEDSALTPGAVLSDLMMCALFCPHSEECDHDETCDERDAAEWERIATALLDAVRAEGATR